MENDFIELVNDNRSLIYKVCNLYCPDKEERADLFQEVVLQLWRSFPGFRHASSGSTWVYRVALNTAISNFRKESKRPGETALTELEFSIEDENNETREENYSQLMKAIGKLNKIEKAIIILYLDERSYDEMSEIVGISVNNVGVRINRIKTKLSKIINTL
jgi:RNA polymerase sigma-70 factor (ECF subfamily)